METQKILGWTFMKPIQPKPVKLLAGILYSDGNLLEVALEKLQASFGPIDYKSEAFEFAITDYYQSEMGSPIFRLFISFENLIQPDQLAEIKLTTNHIEDKLLVNHCRKINIDSGYMDYDKVVLASAKYNAQKIYLSKGIWADLTLHYSKGKFTPYNWSFPDFKKDLYKSTFLQIREKYKLKVKEKT